MSELASGSPEPADASAGVKSRASGPAKDKQDDKGLLGFLRELPVLIVLAFVLAILLKTFVVQAFYIPSGSMEPTLMPGDRVLVSKVLYHPERGDIVVFQGPGPEPDRGLIGGFLHWLSEGLGFARPPNEDYIKRVIGLPGETVEIRDHTVYIDGGPLAEPYLTRAAKLSMGDFGPVQVPPDSLFVMGDNRGNSADSRGGSGSYRRAGWSAGPS